MRNQQQKKTMKPQQKKIKSKSLISNFHFPKERTRSFLISNFLSSNIHLEQILFFLTIILLPIQLGKHFWPSSAYIYSLRIDYLSPALYLWDIVALGLVTIWVFRKGVVNEKALGVLFLFLLTQSISIIPAINQGAAIARLEQLVIVSLFSLYLSSQKIEQVSQLVKVGLILAVIYESILGILEFIAASSLNFWFLGERAFNLSTPSIATFNFYGQVFLRPYATFPHPNVLAAFLVIALPTIIFLDQYLNSSKNILTHNESFIKLSSLVGFTAGILTFSRVAILIIIIELFLYLRAKIKVFAFIVLLALPFLFIRFSSAFNFDSLSLTRREELAEVALSLFAAHPLLGVGLNNFINQIAISELIAGPSRFLQPVHNIFLLSLSETGILGYVGFLIFLGYPLWQLRQIKSFPAIFFISSMFLIIVFLGMFDHYFLTLAQGQRLLFLTWGLSLLIINSYKNTD
jgi:O-antigen ligase